MKELEQFIINNNLEFVSGRRNSDIVILCGYALFLNYSHNDILTAINKPKDSFITSEVMRVYDYAKKNNYKKYWETEEAKKIYKF